MPEPVAGTMGAQPVEFANWGTHAYVRLVRAPVVYPPQADTRLLAQAMTDARIPCGGRVLDVCTGTGVLAIHASRAGAGTVTAVDISRRAVLSARFNCGIREIDVELVHGHFATVLGDRRFDVVLANPPYVPSPADTTSRGAARAWDAGPEGRSALDQLSGLLPLLLDHRGVALIVHSVMCGPDRTLAQLRDGGLKAAIVARRLIPFGPVMRQRAAWLISSGLIAPNQQREELVVIRADRTES
ncbi:HemK2/MTQ2 family protein methyltransferase [Nocardia sp. NPDC049220]|uniref:HemK2/MTQ2 family protein methyltransferase n=1 Tax=Nocardia sp. NPDC049220 TaxID=3155273 RepID=UPI0033DEEE12